MWLTHFKVAVITTISVANELKPDGALYCARYKEVAAVDKFSFRESTWCID